MFMVRIENVELSLQFIATVVRETREVTFIQQLWIERIIVDQN